MNFDSLESVLRRTANRCGLDITRYRPEKTESGRLASMLRHHRVQVVLDVGANVGQFALGLRRGGFTGQIISFEPLKQAHDQLVEAACKDPGWSIAPQVAIGEYEGEIDLHIASNSVSSSVLEMLDSHRSAAPESKYVTSQRVRITTLDSVALDSIGGNSQAFLKVDAQGYEDKVLNGASEVLTRVSGLQLELSFVALYEGQQLFDALMSRLQELGFVPWAIWPGLCDPVSGRMLQVDVEFFRD